MHWREAIKVSSATFVSNYELVVEIHEMRAIPWSAYAILYQNPKFKKRASTI